MFLTRPVPSLRNVLKICVVFEMRLCETDRKCCISITNELSPSAPIQASTRLRMDIMGLPAY
jgi:hypothetical protein